MANILLNDLEYEKDDSRQVGMKSAMKNAASLGSAGMQAGGIWGAAAGVVAGGLKGFYDAFKRKKEVNKQNKIVGRKKANHSTMINTEGANIMNQRTAEYNPDFFANTILKNGGRFPAGLKEHLEEVSKLKTDKVKVLRSGGSVNIIPKGVSHEQENQIGDKGIPVVIETPDDKYEKVLEIEVNEIVFNLENSKKIEEMTLRYQENQDDMDNLKLLGQFIKDQILLNTVDNQGEILKTTKDE